MKSLLTITLFFILSNAFNSKILADEQIDKLTKRIEELERQQEEKRPQVSSFIKDNLTLGGFFEPSYTILRGPDTKLQAANASNLLGLNFAADFTKIHFVSQVLTGISFNLQNQHNDPRAATAGLPSRRVFGSTRIGSQLTQGYLQYLIDDHTAIQAGVGFVPFGFAAQQRELVLFIRRDGPQLLRTTELFASSWSGLNFYQRFYNEDSYWGYNLYSFTRSEDPKLPGLGARAWWNSKEENIIAGLSVQSANYSGNLEENVGADLIFKLKDFSVTSEYARHITENDDDPWSIYIEPGYYLLKEEILLYAFLDYAESPFNKTAGTILDPYHKLEYGLGINWLPTSYTRLRLGLTCHNYTGLNDVIQGQNRDYETIDFSAGVAF